MAYVEIVARKYRQPFWDKMMIDVRGPGSSFAAYGQRCGYVWTCKVPVAVAR